MPILTVSGCRGDKRQLVGCFLGISRQLVPTAGVGKEEKPFSYGETNNNVPFCWMRSKKISTLACKNKSFRARPKSPVKTCRPVPKEGRLAIVTNAERDAVDADTSRDE